MTKFQQYFASVLDYQLDPIMEYLTFLCWQNLAKIRFSLIQISLFIFCFCYQAKSVSLDWRRFDIHKKQQVRWFLFKVQEEARQ